MIHSAEKHESQVGVEHQKLTGLLPASSPGFAQPVQHAGDEDDDDDDDDDDAMMMKMMMIGFVGQGRSSTAQILAKLLRNAVEASLHALEELAEGVAHA